MRIAIRNAGLFAAAAALTCVSLAATAQDKLTYNMAWLPQGSSIGPIVAVAQGYYKDVGLDVNIVRGYGGTRTANELDQGQFEVGYVDPISLSLNRSNGGKIRMIGAINTSWPGGICFDTKRYQVKSPAESTGPWDYYNLLATIPAAEAFRPLEDGGCAFLAE